MKISNLLCFITFSAIIILVNTQATCPSSGYNCAPDCSTLSFCIGANQTPLWNSTCSQLDPNTPYCVGKKCSDKPDSQNLACGAQFVCTDAGQFPDPYDCTAYQVCPGPGGRPQKVTCPPGRVYQSSKKRCRLNILPSCCERFDCSHSEFGLSVFRPDPAFYAACLEINNLPHTLVFKCPDEVSEIFDPEQNECRYNCKISGNFVDRSNCNGYINCRRSGRKWIVTKVDCPKGTWFRLGRCRKEVQQCESIIKPVEPATTLPPDTTVSSLPTQNSTLPPAPPTASPITTVTETPATLPSNVTETATTSETSTTHQTTIHDEPSTTRATSATQSPTEGTSPTTTPKPETEAPTVSTTETTASEIPSTTRATSTTDAPTEGTTPAPETTASEPLTTEVTAEVTTPSPETQTDGTTTAPETTASQAPITTEAPTEGTTLEPESTESDQEPTTEDLND